MDNENESLVGRAVAIAIASLIVGLASGGISLAFFPFVFAAFMRIPAMTLWVNRLLPQLGDLGYWGWFGLAFSVRLFLISVIPLKWKIDQKNISREE
jgi:hypothetical protein